MWAVHEASHAVFHKRVLFFRSYEVLLGVEVVINVSHSVTNRVVDIDLVAQEATDSTEALHELEAIGRLVCDELDRDTVFFVVQAEPVGQLLAAYNLKIDTSVSVLEVLRVLLLLSVEQENFGLVLYGILDLVPHNFDFFKQHHGLECTELQGLHGVPDSKGDHSRVECDLLKEASNDLLLLHELHVSQGVCGQSDGLTESLIETIGDIDCRDDDTFKPKVKVITTLHDEFKISATGNDDTADVGPVIGDKVLRGKFTTLDNVQMTLFLSETRKTHGRLTTATVLLGQLDWHTLNNLLVISLKCGEHYTSTINDDEAKLVVILQE